jgi:hypothetical protein
MFQNPLIITREFPTTDSQTAKQRRDKREGTKGREKGEE